MTALPTSGSANGAHQISLIATDQAGNTSAPTTISFTFETPTSTSGLALAVTAPVQADNVSANGRLIGTVSETGTAIASAEYALDESSSFTPLTLNSSGGFDVPLAATALSAGAHSVTVKASDTAGGSREETVNFTVMPSSFTIGATGTAGWGEATPSNSDIHLEERNSLLVEYEAPVDLDPVAQGTRTISFQVAPQFGTGMAALAGDRLAVSLVNPSNPSQVLLSGDQAGAPLFELGASGAAEFPSGLVSFDGTTVTIDVTSVTQPATGLLIFQLINGGTDDSSTVDIDNLTDTTNASGVSSPTVAALAPGRPAPPSI